MPFSIVSSQSICKPQMGKNAATQHTRTTCIVIQLLATQQTSTGLAG